MKKLLLAVAVMAMSTGSALAVSDFDYQGGSVAGVQGGSGSTATSAGNGGQSGSVNQGSFSTATNSTGATASEVTTPTTVDVTANTVSSGNTSQGSQVTSTGTGVGTTGALSAQVGTSDANASGANANATGSVDADSFGIAGGVFGATTESKTTQGSGGVTVAGNNGSAFYDTGSVAGNTSGAGASSTPFADATTGTTAVDNTAYAYSVGGNVQGVQGNQSGNALGLAASGGEQTGSGDALSAGGIFYGQVGGGEAVLGAGVSANGSSVDQTTNGFVAGVNNGDAISLNGAGAFNQSVSGNSAITTPDNSLTTVNNYGQEVGSSFAGSVTGISNPAEAVAFGNANSKEAGFGGAIGGFTTLP